MIVMYCRHYCMFSLTVTLVQKRPRCSVYAYALLLPSLSPVAQSTGAFFFHGDQWESVCSRAAVWRSRGDQLGCEAWWQQCVKIESNQGSRAWSRFIRLPTAFFSSFISPASFLPPSLSFILPHTHRIRGLCHILGKKVLLLLTKARNSSIWPTLRAVPPSVLPLLLPAVLPRQSPASLCLAWCCTHCKRPI